LYIELNFQTDNCASIRSIRGFSSLVRFEDYMAVIPAYLIDALKQRESEGIFEPLASTLNKGDPVWNRRWRFYRQPRHIRSG
jgi:hypothetical protein